MNRNRIIDITRGIAILSIIMGHLNIGAINRIVFTFHVPIFYIITGFFMKHEPANDFIKKKAKSLLLPYAETCFVIIVLSGVIAFASGGNITDTIKKWIVASLYGAGDSYSEPFGIPAIGAIWFLWALFWGSIFLQMSLTWKRHIRVAWVVGLFIFGYYTSRTLFWFPFSIQAGCCATFFLLIGYSIKSYSRYFKELPLKTKYVLNIAVFSIWIVFIISFKAFWLVHNDFGRGLIDIFGSLCACYCIYLISSGIDRHEGKLTEVVSSIGKNSLIILCVHIIELNLIRWRNCIEFFINKGLPDTVSSIITFFLKISLIMFFTVLISMLSKNCKRKSVL